MIAMAVGNEAVHGIGEHSPMPVCVIYTVSALKSNNSSPPKSAYRQERILRPPAARRACPQEKRHPLRSYAKRSGNGSSPRRLSAARRRSRDGNPRARNCRTQRASSPSPYPYYSRPGLAKRADRAPRRETPRPPQRSFCPSTGATPNLHGLCTYNSCNFCRSRERSCFVFRI